MASPTLYTHVQLGKVIQNLGPVKPHKRNPSQGSCHMTPSVRIQGATLDEERWVVHRTVPGNPTSSSSRSCRRTSTSSGPCSCRSCGSS